MNMGPLSFLYDEGGLVGSGGESSETKLPLAEIRGEEREETR